MPAGCSASVVATFVSFGALNVGGAAAELAVRQSVVAAIDTRMAMSDGRGAGGLVYDGEHGGENFVFWGASRRLPRSSPAH